MSKYNKTKILLISLIPTIAIASPTKITNETAIYSRDGIVINADVLRDISKPVSPPLEINNNEKNVILSHPIIPLTQTEAQLSLTETPAIEDKELYEEETIIKHDLFIYPDESYFDAINRWFKNDGYSNVAWSINDDSAEELSKHPSNAVSFTGYISEALPILSKQIGVPLYISESGNLAAIHQWHNRDVQIVMVHGETVKNAIKNLARDYEWNWVDGESKNRSWLAKNDYPFSASYPLVTPKDDIAKALQVVLNGYPISAQILNGTHSFFIVDTQ
ncbi:hypothetical protein [Shewanella frigidimarina]|uniref:hypothetical protein n=1 Tax=Shewanella frigidimarina TaxID=56812 RepID=UPI003D798268